MGMRWKVQAEGVERVVLEKLVRDRCEVWEKATSHWRRDSELMRFNAAPAGEWVVVSDELWAAVQQARWVADQTDGALDITLGALVEVWGFGASGRRAVVPTNEEIARAKARCGWGQLEFDGVGRRMKKRVGDLQINVASVVEGLVLDECGAELRSRAVVNFLLELGGELLAAGVSPKGEAWLVAVQAPSGRVGEASALLPLVDAALATSGRYRNRFEVEGRVFSHLLNPTTGWPVEHELLSVTVMHESAAWADAYATALLVLGPVQGRVVAAKLGLRVFWIEESQPEH